MGIKGLFEFLKRKETRQHVFHSVADLAEYLKKKYPGKILRIAIDTIFLMYKYFPYNLPYCLTCLLNNLIKHFVTIFVFDGGFNIAKEATIKKRRKKRSQPPPTDLDDINDDIIKNLPETLNRIIGDHPVDRCVSKETIENTLTFFETIRIPYCVAMGEADNKISKLNKEGIVVAGISRDTDFLAMGCPLIIFDGKEIIVIFPEEITEDLGLTYPEFVNMCVLFGCDYCSTNIIKMKPDDIYNVFKELEDKSIEGFIKKTGLALGEEQLKELSTARSIFMESAQGEDITVNGKIDSLSDMIKEISVTELIKYFYKFEKPLGRTEYDKIRMIAHDLQSKQL